MFDSLRKKFFDGLWNAINRKFALIIISLISEYCRTDYDSFVLKQETFPERVRNVSRNAFRNASGTRSEHVRVLERVRNAFFIRLLLSSTVDLTEKKS